MASSPVPLGSILNQYGEPLPPLARRVLTGNERRETSAGNVITADDCLSLDTVLACVRVLAESEAAMPLDLMRKIEEGQFTRVKQATEIPLYHLIRWKPNPEMTAYDFRVWLMVDCILRGRGVAQIIRDGAGNIVELWPLLASRLRAVRRPDGRVCYLYKKQDENNKARTPAKRTNGIVQDGEVLLEFEEVFCINFFFHGGLLGPGIVELQKDHIGSAKGVEDYSNEFFKNGGVISGILKVKDELSEAAYNRLKKDWKENHAKKGQRHSVPILEGGTDFSAVNPNNEETQLLEARKYRRSTLAGVLRVPAHLINDLEKATYSNVEYLDIAFIKHSMRPWLTNWEQRLRLHLLSDKQTGEYYFKHNTRDLERGDFKSRMEGYSQGINSAVINPNQARAWEDWDPYEGGETYYRQGALAPVGSPSPATPANTPSPDPSPTVPSKKPPYKAG